TFGRSTTTWKDATPLRPSRCTTCWLVRTHEVLPSTATTTPEAARSTCPWTSTSTRTLSRRAFWTVLLLSLFAKAGTETATSAATSRLSLFKSVSSVGAFPSTLQAGLSIPKVGNQFFPVLLLLERVQAGQIGGRHRRRLLRRPAARQPRPHPAPDDSGHRAYDVGGRVRRLGRSSARRSAVRRRPGLRPAGA